MTAAIMDRFVLPEHSIRLTMQNQPRQKTAMEAAAPGTTPEVQSQKREPVSKLRKLHPHQYIQNRPYIVFIFKNSSYINFNPVGKNPLTNLHFYV